MTQGASRPANGNFRLVIGLGAGARGSRGTKCGLRSAWRRWERRRV